MSKREVRRSQVMALYPVVYQRLYGEETADGYLYSSSDVLEEVHEIIDEIEASLAGFDDGRGVSS